MRLGLSVSPWVLHLPICPSLYITPFPLHLATQLQILHKHPKRLDPTPTARRPASTLCHADCKTSVQQKALAAVVRLAYNRGVTRKTDRHLTKELRPISPATFLSACTPLHAVPQPDEMLQGIRHCSPLNPFPFEPCPLLFPFEHMM